MADKYTWSGHRCPKCKSTRLAVVVQMWAAFNDHGTEVYHDDCPDNDQFWDDSSQMNCRSCGHTGTGEEFFEDDDG